jgi:hypothetical protein
MGLVSVIISNIQEINFHEDNNQKEVILLGNRDIDMNKVRVEGNGRGLLPEL